MDIVPRKPPNLKRTATAAKVETPIVKKHQQKKRKVSKIGIYTPSYSRLRKDFQTEFNRFLQSLKKAMDQISDTTNSVLLPLDRTIRKCHKSTSKMELHFKSMSYWKSFFKSFIERCDDVIQLFRLDKIGDVDSIIEEAKLPQVLISFVKENLTEWKRMFAEKAWMQEYQKAHIDYESVKRELQEEEKKSAVITNILAGCEKYKINIDEIENLDFSDPKLVVSWFEKRISEAKIELLAKDSAASLRLLPASSKRMSTREWCKRHYETVTATSSDDEASADAKSSLFEEGGDTDSDVSSSEDCRDKKVDGEEHFDSFFASMGL